MLTLDILHSVEFYVILTVVAAAVIAVCARPSGRGAVETHLVAGALTEVTTYASPSISIECTDSGDVIITRHGLKDVFTTGAATLAITQKGNDISIIERITAGAKPYSKMDEECRVLPVSEFVDASFVLTFLGREWYHVKYQGEGSRFAAFSLHVRPGIKINKQLVQ